VSLKKRTEMQNPIKLLVKIKDKINKEKRSLTLEEIPQGKVEDASVPPAFLTRVKSHGESPVYNLPPNREFFIGRNSKNDLCLGGKDVSDVHAKIRPEKENYILYDLMSESGITVNWSKTLKRKLEHRDRIKIGSHVLIFEFAKEEEEVFDGMEIRKTVRIKPLMTINFLVGFKKKLKEYHGVVKDISLDGAQIETEKGLRKGSIIEAGISSSELPVVEAIAQVIWERMREKGGKILHDVGLQFLEMDEESRKRLRDYLVKCVS
jgi:pSer/pThr/pTyr-binding forkhead associated (FHA) protein